MPCLLPLTVGIGPGDIHAFEQHEQSQRENPASDIFLIYYNFNPDFLVEIAKVSERSERALRKMSDK